MIGKSVKQNSYVETPRWGPQTSTRESSYTLIDKEIKCIEYAPDVFEFLRQQDGIKVDDLQASLSVGFEANIERAKIAGEGMGKSGSFFFFSHDSRFLIKTATTDDFNAKRLYEGFPSGVEIFPSLL